MDEWGGPSSMPTYRAKKEKYALQISEHNNGVSSSK